MRSKTLCTSLALFLAACTSTGTPSDENITSFEECAAAGYPIMESYPEQCRTADGKSFTRDIGNEIEKQDIIRAGNPRPGDTLSGTVEISGEARGTWYFEATFPVELMDAQGNALTETYAEAQTDWMTEEFVPFKATLTIPDTVTATQGTLFLRKSNASGLAEHDDALEIPVRFD